MQRLSRPLHSLSLALKSPGDRRLYQRNLRSGFAFARSNVLSTPNARRQFSATTTATEEAVNAEEGEAKPEDKRNRLASLKMKKIQAQRAQFKEDAEVDFYSLPGLFVIVLAAGVSFGLYKVDQTKHEGLTWFKGSFMGMFSKRNTLEDFLKYRKEHPFKSMPRDLTAPQIISTHLLNYITLKGNEEGIYSKFYRWLSMPEPPLLPPLKSGAQGMQRTLVIDVDTVIHSSWQRETYFSRVPRPLYAEFMWKMAQCGYEIVLWSNEESFDWEEDMGKLDPNGLGCNMLWNKDVYYYNGHKCKNLRWLNRKMKNVILLDSNPRSAQLQPENTIILTPWTGDNKTDTELSDVSDFLSYIAMADVQDVRKLLESYEGKHIPSAFKEQYIRTLQGN